MQGAFAEYIADGSRFSWLHALSVPPSQCAICPVRAWWYRVRVLGWFQEDDNTAAGIGCRSPNPYTNECTCPAGTRMQWSGRVLTQGSESGLVGSTLVVCVVSTGAFVPVAAVKVVFTYMMS